MMLFEQQRRDGLLHENRPSDTMFIKIRITIEEMEFFSDNDVLTLISFICHAVGTCLSTKSSFVTSGLPASATSLCPCLLE